MAISQFHSLRARLLLWYALILALLIVTLTVLLYYNVHRSIYAELDGRLRAHALALAANLRPQADGTFELDLAEGHVEYFQSETPDAPFYVIWNRDGGVIDRSSPELAVAKPVATEAGAGGAMSVGEERHVAVRGPGESVILVGQSSSAHGSRLRQLLWVTVAIGAGIMALALVGGVFLTWRALAPVDRITRAARAISASNLAERIDLTRTEGELAQLGATLNDAFQRLQEAFEQQTRFTADASHELRTPLSIILSTADLALRKERSEDEYRRALETTLGAARRMKGIIEALLTLARADAKQLRPAREVVALEGVVGDAVALLAPLAAERGVSVETGVEGVRVLGDRTLLQELAVNLVKNSILYNRPGGRVTVALAREGEEAVLTVADTGIGIPAADQPHVFERFYRVDKSRRSHAEGSTGLGLAISQWIARAHDGSIGFTSEEGKGTRFFVRLKRVDGVRAAGAVTA